MLVEDFLHGHGVGDRRAARRTCPRMVTEPPQQEEDWICDITGKCKSVLPAEIQLDTVMKWADSAGRQSLGQG